MSIRFGRMEGARHLLPARVYFADTDAAGIVYHGRYIEFAERGRSEFLAEIGFAVGDMQARFGVVWVISDIAIRYVLPGRVDDVLEISTEIVALKAATLTMRQQIGRIEPGGQRTLLADATVKAAVVDLDSGRPKRFDPAFRAALEALLPQ